MLLTNMGQNITFTVW